MNTIISFVIAHQVAFTVAFLYSFLAAVETAPAPGDPRPAREQVYQWAYDFLHILANKVIERHPNLAPVTPATESK